MALPKANRLSNRRDFAAVYRYGIRRSKPNLTLRALRQPVTTIEHRFGQLTPLMPGIRVGITVSRKVSKLAVVRNRIRRRLHAALLLLLPDCSSGWDLVIVVHHQATQCEYREFLRELEQLLVEAEVLHGNPGRCLL
ncbi:MAG: ribonuclease P protein component [Cyanothece sp. SIO1E1]|nr:ribonuclease P protein component [Cyanothece sp. SIO1E1]